MARFKITLKEIQQYSCDSLAALSNAFKAAGRYDIAAYFEKVARAKACPV